MTEPIEKQLIAVVHGRVQGVGFRQFVVHEARRIGVRGTVRNQPDGTVRAVLEGPTPKLELMLRLLAKGPSASHVDEIESEWQPATGQFTGVQIVY